MVVVDPRKIKIEPPIQRTQSIREPAALKDAQPISSTGPIERPAAPNHADARSDSTSKGPTRRRKNTQAILPTTTTPGTPASSLEATLRMKPNHGTPPADAVLFTIRNLGRTLDDIERLRIMNGNRVAAGKREGIELPWMDAISAQLDALEHSIKLELKRAWRKHPLAAWAKAIPGAGEVLVPRLIAEIGDPADRPNPAKLLAYCGHGDPARAGHAPKGATQEELFKRGNPAAKKATWKLAYQFMRTVGYDAQAIDAPMSTPAAPVRDDAATTKGTTTSRDRSSSPRSPYRDIYEQRKAATEGKLHDKPCKRCGPSGHPALPGSPWSNAHRNADALRIVGKRFLVDLWIASRHSRPDAPSPDAGGDPE